MEKGTVTPLSGEKNGKEEPIQGLRKGRKRLYGIRREGDRRAIKRKLQDLGKEEKPCLKERGRCTRTAWGKREKGRGPLLECQPLVRRCP